MSVNIRRVDYFSATVQDQPGEAYRLLSQLSELGINLLALTAVPVGPMRSQFTLFPEESHRLQDAGRKANLALDGPHPALMMQGNGSLSEIADAHERLYQAGVNVYAASGVMDGRGSFGYVLYVRPEQYEQAAAALGV